MAIGPTLIVNLVMIVELIESKQKSACWTG